MLALVDYFVSDYDTLRSYCLDLNLTWFTISAFFIVYTYVKSFWTLTANGDSYRHDDALELARQKGLSPEGVSG